MKQFTMGVSALAVLTGLIGTSLADENVTAWRLFISDHTEPVVRVVDAITSQEITHFHISAPGSLSRSNSGRTVFAVQGSAGEVTAIATGIDVHEHGDHADIAVTEPRLSGFSVKGDRPAHFVEHSGRFAAFFDGEGLARVFSENAALAGAGELNEVKANAPHHGVVVPFGSYSVVSVYDSSGDGAVVGVQVQDAAGTPVSDVIECVGLHGEAFSGNIGALGGCKDGILLIRSNGGQPSVELLKFTDALPEGRVSTMLGGRGLQYFLGNFDADTVSIIDPGAEEAFRLVDLPTRRVDFAVDPIRPRFAYVFTEDGTLHQLDIISATVNSSLRLTEPYSMDGPWNDPRPRIAVAGDNVYVSDPLAGKIHVIAADGLSREGEIAIDGKPFNLVAVGGSGIDHTAEDHNHHAHNHDHDSQISQGYFEDNQVADRPLANWAGDWQSVYPYLIDGTLDPVMTHKAESGTMTADEYRAYYETGYATEVDRITIADDVVTFYVKGTPVSAHYANDGYEILTYEKGNRGVRFIFRKVEGDDAAPQFIQFSDHRIAPEIADHYHLYWGDDRAALLEEMNNWPTYYPSSLDARAIVHEMIEH